MLVPTFQIFMCGSVKLFTWTLFTSIIIVLILRKANKIFFNKSELTLIFLVIALNIFYVLLLEKNFFYIRFSYVIILSILFAKILGEYFSLDELITFVSKIYMIVISIMVLEYIAYMLGNQKIISEVLVCEISDITQYKTLSNNFSNLLGIPIRGLNFPFMGPQVASQMSAVSFLWFFIIWASDRNRYSHLFYWAALSLTLLIISPSATIIIALLLVVGFTSIAYLYYNHKHIAQNHIRKIVTTERFFATILIIIIGIYVTLKFALINYQDLDYIIDKYILGHFNILDNVSVMEALFGIGLDDLNKYISGSPTEIGILSQLLRVGIIGILIFGIFLLYVIKPIAGIIEKIFFQKKYFILASLTTLLIYILSDIHYEVIFRDGATELFILHLSLFLALVKKYRY